MNEVVWSLGAVSDLWLTPDHPLREETIQALTVSTGLHRRQIELALSTCFEELSTPKISAFITTFVKRPRRTLNVLHVLPSNAFSSWVHGAVTTLLLGHALALKPSTQEPVFARAWKRSLELAAPELAKKVDVIDWDEKRLPVYGAVVAYGSDETLVKIRSFLSPDTIFVGYGHKLSAGVVFVEALAQGLSQDLLDRVARDSDPFRLQGCLSPQILYIEDASLTRWPELEMRLDAAPRIRAFATWGEILNDLRTFTPFLSCIGFAGHKNRAGFLEREGQGLGLSRICPLGEMQRPPLGWRNGGLFLPDLLH